MLPKVLTAVLASTAPKMGDVAPDFTVQDTDGKTYTLSEMVKQGPVILAFFPKAFTSGCTKELTSYQARFAEIQTRKAQILAVSTDETEKQKKFKASLNASYPFIADSKSTLTDLYGVGIPLVGLANRFTFVIGEGRKILEVESGSDAVDVSKSINACPLQKPSHGGVSADAGR